MQILTFLLCFFSIIPFNRLHAQYRSEAQRRAAEEWKLVENRYNETIRTIRSRPSSVNVYTGPSTYYNAYANDYANKQKAYELRQQQQQKAAEERKSWLKSQNDAVDRAAEENRLIREQREAAKIKQAQWEKATANDPLATLEPVPAFANKYQRYGWYYHHALQAGDFYYQDSRAALVAAQLAWDGIGTKDDKTDSSMALTLILKARDCNMRNCLMGEILESGFASNAAANLPNALKAYKVGTNYTDTAGLRRSYKNLYRLFTTKKVALTNSINDGVWAISTYAWGVENLIPGSEVFLSDALNTRTHQLAQCPGWLLEKLANIYNIKVAAYAETGLDLWCKAGTAYEIEGEDCTAAYLKVFDTDKGTEEIRTRMRAKLQMLRTNGMIDPNRLSTAQQTECFFAWRAYTAYFDTAVTKGEAIETGDALTLFSYYNNGDILQRNEAKATQYASVLIKNGNTKTLQLTALALRLGKSGLVKNDAKAFKIHDLIALKTPAITTTEKKDKAVLLDEIAAIWLENQTTGLSLDLPKYQYFLEKAANLHPFYAEEYAMSLLKDKSGPANYKKMMVWLAKALEYHNLFSAGHENTDNSFKTDASFFRVKDFMETIKGLADAQKY